MESHKQAIMAALDKFTRQRPGLEFGNYGDVRAYQSEMRSITRDLHHYRELERAVLYDDAITADALLAASQSAYSGRLSITQCAHGESARVTCGANPKHTWCEACDPAPAALCHWCNGRGHSTHKPGATRIDYCTGQYFPAEYRKAACAVLAYALWSAARAHMPAPDSWRVESYGKWSGSRFIHEHGDMHETREAAELELGAKGGREYGSVHEYYGGKSAGDYLRAQFRRRFGRGIAARWFN